MGKVQIKSRFAVTPNHLLNDPEISLKAKGLYALIQSKPDGWRFSKARIAKQTKDGKSGIQSAIAELEESGYLRKKPAQDGDGKFTGYDWELVDYPSPEKPSTDNPAMENRVAISKKENSKKEIVKKRSIAEIEIPAQPFNFEEKVQKMINEGDHRMQIIALFWLESGQTFRTKEMYQKAIKRSLRASSALSAYSLEEVHRVVRWLKENADYKWELETVVKYISRPLPNTKKKNKIAVI